MKKPGSGLNGPDTMTKVVMGQGLNFQIKPFKNNSLQIRFDLPSGQGWTRVLDFERRPKGDSMRDALSAAMKDALRAKDKRKLSTLRLILAAIKDRDIAARSEDRNEGVSDDEILSILQKMVKQRNESSTMYEEAGRLELAEGEREEIAIIQEYLPQQMSDDEVRAATEATVKDIEAAGLKDMGRTMGALKERYAGVMDFKKASAVVKELLG